MYVMGCWTQNITLFQTECVLVVIMSFTLKIVYIRVYTVKTIVQYVHSTNSELSEKDVRLQSSNLYFIIYLYIM